MDISKESMKKTYLKHFKLDTYWKKEDRENEKKMQRRCTSSYGRLVCELGTGDWGGGQTSLEIVCRKTLPYGIE
jgi:hypothetical protein